MWLHKENNPVKRDPYQLLKAACISLFKDQTELDYPSGSLSAYVLHTFTNNDTTSCLPWSKQNPYATRCTSITKKHPVSSFKD